MNDWAKAAASVGICVAVIAVAVVTKNASVAWGLIFIPILYKAL